MNTRRIRMTVVALVTGAAMVAGAGDSTWTNWAAGATGEYWTNAVNWANAAGANVLPDNGHANLTRTNASYTVMYDATAPAISNLFVQNKAGNRTKLILSAPLAHTGGYISLSNAAVYVTNNAAWSYPGINSTADRLLEIVGGAELVVCGGAVQFTNLLRATTTQRSYINVGTGSTGTLRVASGTFDFWGTNNAANSSHVMFIGRYSGGVGAAEIGEGARMTLGQGGGSGANLWPIYVGLNGGRGTLTVAGELAFPAAGPYASVGGNNGSYGELVVTNNGRISGGGRWTIGGGGNCLGVVRFCGTNNMTPGPYGWDQLNVGFNNSEAGRSTGRLDMVSGSIKLSGMLVVGAAEGNTNYSAVGAMNIYGGTVTHQTLYGCWIGWGRDAGNAEGTLTMTGGAMLINGGSAFAYPGNSPYTTPTYGRVICGLTIGMVSKNGTADDPSPYSRAKGTLNLSGGAITNNYDLVIGCNGGTGTLIQTGGTMKHVPADTNRLTCIGYGFGTNSYSGAGNGTYDLSGGTFATPSRVFIGGVPTDIQWYAKSGAVGLLKVTGGSFTCSNTVTVGGNGAGTLTIGSNGVCSVKDLVLANNTAGTLRFEFGANGIGTLTATGTLAINAGAKLQVDVGTYRPTTITEFTLVDCAARSGSFAAQDITISGYDRAWVDQTAGGDIVLHVLPPPGGISIKAW